MGGLIEARKTLLDAGADNLMIQSEGIIENMKAWRTGMLFGYLRPPVILYLTMHVLYPDVLSKIIGSLPITKLMFEAADPRVFEWYIQNHGTDVNLFIDHSQARQLACLSSGIWCTNKTFGRVVHFREWRAKP